MEYRQKTVTSLRRVAGKDMLADCLTKAGGSAEQLMHVLQTGQYELQSDISGVEVRV